MDQTYWKYYLFLEKVQVCGWHIPPVFSEPFPSAWSTLTHLHPPLTPSSMFSLSFGPLPFGPIPRLILKMPNVLCCFLLPCTLCRGSPLHREAEGLTLQGHIALFYEKSARSSVWFKIFSPPPSFDHVCQMNPPNNYFTITTLGNGYNCSSHLSPWETDLDLIIQLSQGHTSKKYTS